MSEVIYEVTVEVESALGDAFVRYMTEQHIPEIYATGCFHRIRFERASPTVFRTVYHAASPADLERYLEQHAEAFRADFVAHFPAGATVTRATWAGVASFPVDPGVTPI